MRICKTNGPVVIYDIAVHSPGAPHTPPDPAGAGRGKGRPQADPEGTRSALPATEATGMLIGVGRRALPSRRASPTWQPRILFRSPWYDRGPNAAASPECPPPVPIQSPKGSTRP